MPNRVRRGRPYVPPAVVGAISAADPGSRIYVRMHVPPGVIGTALVLGVLSVGVFLAPLAVAYLDHRAIGTAELFNQLVAAAVWLILIAAYVMFGLWRARNEVFIAERELTQRLQATVINADEQSVTFGATRP
jgi:hypothetical protein